MTGYHRVHLTAPVAGQLQHENQAGLPLSSLGSPERHYAASCDVDESQLNLQQLAVETRRFPTLTNPLKGARFQSVALRPVC